MMLAVPGISTTRDMTTHDGKIALHTIESRNSRKQSPALKAEPPITPPPPPQVVNNGTLAPPLGSAGVRPSQPPVTQTAPADITAVVPGKAYMIQVGVFASPANARALQKKLRRAGIEANLETRVQLGPFKDKREADKALARAKKLGINAVLVSSR